MDKRLKKILFYHAASALCATILISGALLSDKYVTTLSDTLNQLVTFKSCGIMIFGPLRSGY